MNLHQFKPDLSSLTVRLSISLSMVGFAAAGVILAVLLIKLNMERDTLQDRSLEWQAKDIAVYLHRSPETGNLTFDLPAELTRAYDQPNSQYLYLISDLEGRELFRSRRGSILSGHLPADDAACISYFEFRDIEYDQTFYGANLKFWIGQNAFIVQVAQGPDHSDVLADTLIEEFFEQQWWVLLLFLMAIVATVVLIVRTSLAPVEKVARVARKLGPGTLNVRLDAASVPTEIKPIVAAVNQALDEIEKGYRREREFASNAAHQLRTPLTIIRADLERNEFDRSKALDEVASLERLVQQFLHLAQADNFFMVEETVVDLRKVAEETVSLLAPYGVSHGQEIELQADDSPVIVRGSEGFVGVALRNLVENALAYSDAGTVVRVVVHDENSVSVWDSGRGIPRGMRDRVFSRFWRADRSVEDGAGLGLAIVSQIVAGHGGSISLRDNPAGGSVFTATFVKILPDHS